MVSERISSNFAAASRRRLPAIVRRDISGDKSIHPGVAFQRVRSSYAIAAHQNEIITLQRTVGNQAVRQLLRNNLVIQRKKLTEEEKREDLQSDYLKQDSRLQQAFDNSPLMRYGEIGEGVKTLQRALRDLNYPLPISFAKTGDADGIFKQETWKAVWQFQKDNKLGKDGIVGRNTLRALDQKFLATQKPCAISYFSGPLNHEKKEEFIKRNFSPADQPQARKVLDDLCDVQYDVLSFASEKELRDEIMKRVRTGQYTQETQTSGAFGYPEVSGPPHKDPPCPGKIGHALRDAQVNKAAQAYWNGPILETRSSIQNRHYYFELTDAGKQNAYDAMVLLFTPQSNICDKTLIHCDTLITLVHARAYADTIGKQQFNAKVRAGALNLWLTYDGMSITQSGTEATPVSVSLQHVRPSNENDLLIGDHVIFWNHLGYDAISKGKPGPWRLENAILVNKDSSGRDLYEGHGAPEVGGGVQPGNKDEVKDDLKDAYNAYAADALSITNRIDAGDAAARTELSVKYPQVRGPFFGQWYIEETTGNRAYRPPAAYDLLPHYYLLRVLAGPSDPKIIGLRDPSNPAVMNKVKRPVESQ